MKPAKAMPTMEWRPSSGVSVATLRLHRINRQMRVNATSTVPVTPTLNAEESGESTSTKEVSKLVIDEGSLPP